MNYDIIKDNDTEKEVNISVPSSELDRFMDNEISKIRKDLTIKGFRKGKVPATLIRTRYKATLKAQAMSSMINESFITLIQEKKWQAASQAELLNVDEGKQITFTLRFEVIPDFPVENYHNIEIFQEESLPDEYLLEQSMKEIRERYSATKEVMRPVAVDDYVTVDLDVIENSTVKNQRTNVVIRVGDRSWPDEINRTLVGMKKSERKEVTIQNHVNRVFLKKIEEKTYPAIDDAFAQSKGLDNVEVLKKKLLEEAKKFEEKRIEDELKEALSKVLLERMQYTVPKAFVENEYKKILQRLNQEDTESIKERFWAVAERRARLNIIIDKIAVKEDIRAEEKEIMNAINTMGLETNHENRQDVITYIGTLLTREKTLDYLYKNAKISKKSRIISPKEAMNDTSAIRH